MQPTASHLNEFHTNGFTLLRNVLPPHSIPNLRLLLSNCINDDLSRWSRNPDYHDHWMVHNLMARHIDFAKVMENPVLQAYLCEILGDSCIVYAYTSSSMPPKGTNYSRRIHVDSPRLIKSYYTNVGAILALDDFTDDNGATYFLPGSQWRTDPPSETEFLSNSVRAYPKAGDMVLFSARTWHMGGENHTDRPRHALTINACRSFMKQRFDFPRLVPTEIVNTLSAVGTRFLGMNSRIPTTLEDYYVPPEQRLYQSGQG
jgi:ectoine hydroxylase-related dioxygenase (phytanoyl-CoA dioxygenase family)